MKTVKVESVVCFQKGPGCALSVGMVSVVYPSSGSPLPAVGLWVARADGSIVSVPYVAHRSREPFGPCWFWGSLRDFARAGAR